MYSSSSNPSSTIAMRHSSGWETLISISFFMRRFSERASAREGGSRDAGGILEGLPALTASGDEGAAGEFRPGQLGKQGARTRPADLVPPRAARAQSIVAWKLWRSAAGRISSHQGRDRLRASTPAN